MNRDWTSRAVSAAEAVSHIRSGMKLFINGAAATPTPLLDALAARTDHENVETLHLHLEGRVAICDNPGIRPNSLFTGPSLRKAIEEGRADFTPIYLSDIPVLLMSDRIELDAAILQLSPPDRHGFCTLGTSVDAALAASRRARVIIAEINEQMPRTHGNTLVHIDKITAFVHTNRQIIIHEPVAPNAVEQAIGAHIAPLVPDGATLQMGIGAIPNAVLALLFDKTDLGIHTEMFSDAVLDLVEAGVITNRKKKVHPGRITTSFVVGSQRLYDFVDDNPFVDFYPCDHTNDTAVIRKNDKVVAMNSAIEVDLSGQVVADSIGHRIYSGIGGQMDFMRGAALSPGGVPVIALPATASNGKFSRITTTLKSGGGVVTTRGHVHWIVTEFGAVNLWGKSLRERADALISIAHPDFRQELRREISGIRRFDMAMTTV
ncbi:MAG TPA: acetyl-CoA hydrolase/transferase C-terminal domain-containing protein [Thermoanaerobaculia bacterium]|nr:acetyl-CoA hydrolase/transferase C-terminal domain-containing protein [Thermoanaerobaculia bacterium]